MKVRLTRRALADLHAIAHYLKDRNPRAAERVEMLRGPDHMARLVMRGARLFANSAGSRIVPFREELDERGGQTDVS